jgi:hypothetical protein
MRMSENMMLRRLFELKREEVAGGWRRLHNEEHRNLFASRNIVIKSRTTRWVGNIACMLGKPEGKRLFGRPRRRLEDNIKMDLTEIERKMWTGCIWLRIGTTGGLL